MTLEIPQSVLNEYQKLKEERTQLELDMSILRKEHAQFKATVETMRDEVTKLSKKKEEATLFLKENASIIQELEKATVAFNAVDAKSKQAVLEERRLNGVLQKLTSEVSKLTNTKESIGSTIERNKQSLEDKRQELALLHTQVKDERALLVSEKKGLLKRISDIERKEALAEELDRTRGILEKGNAELLKQQLVLLNENEAMQSSLSSKKIALEKAEEEHRKLSLEEIDLDTKRAEIEALLEKQEKQEMQTKLAIAENEERIQFLLLSKRPISYYISGMQKEFDRRKIKVSVMDILNSL